MVLHFFQPASLPCPQLRMDVPPVLGTSDTQGCVCGPCGRKAGQPRPFPEEAGQCCETGRLQELGDLKHNSVESLWQRTLGPVTHTQVFCS